MARPRYCRHGFLVGAPKGNCTICVAPVPVDAPLPHRVCADLVSGGILAVLFLVGVAENTRRAASTARVAFRLGRSVRLRRVPPMARVRPYDLQVDG